MFKRLQDVAYAGDDIVIELDGETVSVPAAVSVAAALLYLGAIPTRNSIVGGVARAPFCMMGVCFECLVEIDGAADQRACQIQVRPGMQVRRQLSTQSENAG
jgi:predicted molibdopterin-dependent oxidoreductase YjgC